jgi:hypothetical protein
LPEAFAFSDANPPFNATVAETNYFWRSHILAKWPHYGRIVDDLERNPTLPSLKSFLRQCLATEEGSNAVSNGQSITDQQHRLRNAYLEVFLLPDEASVFTAFSTCIIPFTDDEQITAFFGSGLEMPVPAGMVLEESVDAAFNELLEWSVLIFLHDVDNDKVHLICEGGPYEVEREEHKFFLEGRPSFDAKVLNRLPPPFDQYSDRGSFYFRWTACVSCLDREDGLREVESISVRLYGDRGGDCSISRDALEHMRWWLDGIEFYGEESYFDGGTSSSDEESD